MNQYDNPEFFDAYAQLSRSQWGLEGAGEWHHHTLTQILNSLLQIGFVIEAVEDARPPDQWRDQMPEEMRRPMMLPVRARKQKNAPSGREQTKK